MRISHWLNKPPVFVSTKILFWRFCEKKKKSRRCSADCSGIKLTLSRSRVYQTEVHRSLLICGQIAKKKRKHTFSHKWANESKNSYRFKIQPNFLFVYKWKLPWLFCSGWNKIFSLETVWIISKDIKMHFNFKDYELLA